MDIERRDPDLIRSLGRIEGRLDGIEARLDRIEQLSERVSNLEQWLSWLKGGWAVLVAALAYMFKGIYSR
jgi:hypothetical protein